MAAWSCTAKRQLQWGRSGERRERERERERQTDTDTDTDTDSLLEAKGHVASEAVWLVERTGKNTLRVQALSQNTEQESISWFLQDRSGAFSK